MPISRILIFFLCVFFSACVYAVDVNRASATQLQTIKGIGPVMAQKIIQERMRSGPYRSLSDLVDRIQGIGPKRLQHLVQNGLRLGTSGGPAIKETPSSF